MIRSLLASDDAPGRPVLRYHGGKFRAARRLVALMPPHRTYVEPYMGAASVLLAKPPAYSEVINDLDGEVVNLFRVLRDPLLALRLKAALELTPFARAEFEASHLPARGRVERARRMVVRSFMGFGSAASNAAHVTGFRADSKKSGTTPAHDWAHYPEALAAFTARLAGVVIESRDARRVIASHDGPETLHFVDPPYVLSTRRVRLRNAAYRHDMTDADHVDLAQSLHAATGMVLLCGYEGPLYDTLYKNWERLQYRAWADGAQARTECVWFNPAAWERQAQGTLLLPTLEGEFADE